MEDPNLAAVRTKIVATIGPASNSPEVLRRLIAVGVDVFRLNFSHGTHDDHATVLRHLRELSRQAGRIVGVLQDLCGPKIRLGPIPGDVVECPLGSLFTLTNRRTPEDPHELTCSYQDLADDLQPGESVLFADGTVAMTVLDVVPGRARLKVTLPGRLRSRQGLNLPRSNLHLTSLTDKDLQDLDWTARHADDIQYVGLSFARTPADIELLRKELQARNISARIIVKIEKPQAVANLEAMIAAADGAMVARGDLGVEMDVTQVPAIQKRIIALCNQAHRPVITATQMLNSMEHSSRPTRAEASDVFNAVLDGTDAVMLSGETAVGDYPVETVATMGQICAQAERYHADRTRLQVTASSQLADLVHPITEAMVDAAWTAAKRLSARLIVVGTVSGRSALALSNRRPSAMILALTFDQRIAATLSVCWGVTPVVVPAHLQGSSDEDTLGFAIDWAKSHQLVQTGEHVVFLRGEIPGQPASRTVKARLVP